VEHDLLHDVFGCGLVPDGVDQGAAEFDVHEHFLEVLPA
jgi:hypothetical protein